MLIGLFLLKYQISFLLGCLKCLKAFEWQIVFINEGCGWTVVAPHFLSSKKGGDLDLESVGRVSLTSGRYLFPGLTD